MSKLLKLAPDCTRISAEHGFWDEKETRNKGEMVALIVSELSEAVEGDRKNTARNNPVDEKVAYIMNNGEMSPNWCTVFVDEIKDSVADEMADTVIRVLDYIHGWDFEVYHAEYRKQSTGNFAHDILRIQWYIILAFHDNVPGKDWGYVLAAIEAFCDWYKIDIEQHVQWKMKYNESRPHKHGKKY